MKKTTRTSKKQIHELEAMARETIDKSARLYARNEYDATGKAYAVINGTRTAYASNTALYDAVAEMVLSKQAEEFQTEPEPIIYATERTEATEPEPEPAQVAAEAESLKDVDAYAHDAKTNANAAAWALDRMTKDHRETAAELARFARTCADLAKDAADKAAASYEHARRTYYADYQTSTYAAQALAIRAEQRDDAQKEAQRAEETAQEVEAIAAKASEIDDAPAPIYQRYELLAYLGEPDDYDVTAIERDATAYDAATGRTVWAVDAETLAAIAERHQLQFYAPAF